MADEKDAPEAGRRLHVTALLVASRRALDNALSELGFANDDDRVIEHDGRLAFLTCTHDEDCDDMFALISELSARGESWELQSRIDTEAGRAVYQSMARYRPVEAVDAAVEEDAEPDAAEAPAHDVETREGLEALALHSTLDKGMGSTTLEFKISFVRPITPETGTIRAEGVVVSRGRRVGTAEGRFMDQQGRLLVHGTTTCLIFET
jgi:hypothetical protein